MENYTAFRDGEADQWHERNKDSGLLGGKVDYIAWLSDWLSPFKTDISKIIEIGSGGGHILSQCCNDLDADGVGVEPSKNAVESARNKYPNLTFHQGFGDKLDFENQIFDLVHLGFFLYLVDRDKYLACFSEADRLLKDGGFLSIIDFDPSFSHSKEYRHHEAVRSFKHDNSKVLLATGKYSLVNKISFSHADLFFSKDQDERVSLSLFYKEPDAFRCLT
jgi:ubiquinone/menaquinone biosynthesis C-methylase UbiE